MVLEATNVEIFAINKNGRSILWADQSKIVMCIKEMNVCVRVCVTTPCIPRNRILCHIFFHFDRSYMCASLLLLL